MNTASIRKQLHDYLEIAVDKKLKAIYTMVEDDIIASNEEYTEEFKAELDRRVEYYLSGGKIVTPTEMKKRLRTARKNRQ